MQCQPIDKTASRSRLHATVALALVLPGAAAGCSLLAGCRLGGSLAADQMQLPHKHLLRTPPFTILSDFPIEGQDELVEPLRELERSIRQTIPLPEVRHTITIYLFADRGTYQRFLSATYPRLPARRAFFIADADREVVYTYRGRRLSEDLRHEACHALLHAAVGELPLWLDEGLAEYFELPAEANGLHPRHLPALRRRAARGWKPDLQRLEALRSVRDMGEQEYREAWAWVYLLLHRLPGGRQLLADYLHQIASGQDPGPFSRWLAERYRGERSPEELMVEFLTGTGD